MIYPHRIKDELLDYQWSGFQKVILFVTDHDYADVIDWYSKNYPNSEARPQSDGQFELYHPNAFCPEESALLADLCIEGPILELEAYIGARQISPLAKSCGARVFGAYFIHEKKK